MIELLVVVAIIALLVAILVPSLQRAREQAERTVCLSNLRQIGTALHSYESANGVLPGYMEPYQVPSVDWVKNVSDWPIPYGGASPMHGDYYAYGHDMWFLGGRTSEDYNPSAENPNPRKLNIYLTNAEQIFKCPSDRGTVNLSPATGDNLVPLYDRKRFSDGVHACASGTSYLYNASPGLYGPCRILSFKPIHEIRHPAMQIAFADATMLYTWLAPEAVTTTRYEEFAGFPWHDLPKYHKEDRDLNAANGGTFKVYAPRGNAVFIDGHAQTVTFLRRLTSQEYIVYQP